jgi:hypothetical protein
VGCLFHLLTGREEWFIVIRGMADSVNITATISDKNVVSNFVGSLPLKQNCSFEDAFYSQIFGATNLDNPSNCVSLNMISEILRGFADEKTIDFLDSYKIFIPDAENVYIALSLIMNNRPSIQAMVFSIGEDSVFGFDGKQNDIKFSLMPKEKNLELYYSSLINHEHYHEVFGNLKEPTGLLFLKYEKKLISSKQSSQEYYKRPDFSIANVMRIILNTLEKVNPVFNVSGDFATDEFEFGHTNQYFIDEAITLNIDVLDFLIAR